MDAVNGNATVNVHDFERCCSGIANIHEETFEQRRKTKMQTIEEYKAYTKQLEGDISNMKYDDFLVAYRSIIKKACFKLKKGGFACFVVGEVRGKDGNYIGFVPDTIRAFMDCGMSYYNEAILLNPIASASMRADGNMKTKKLVKVHQNVLVFKKAS